MTLGQADYSNRIVELTDALTANIAVILPTFEGAEWIVFNSTSGAHTLTVRTSAGAGPTIAQTKRAIVYCDGTNVVRATPDA